MAVFLGIAMVLPLSVEKSLISSFSILPIITFGSSKIA